MNIEDIKLIQHERLCIKIKLQIGTKQEETILKVLNYFNL